MGGQAENSASADLLLNQRRRQCLADARRSLTWRSVPVAPAKPPMPVVRFPHDWQTGEKHASAPSARRRAVEERSLGGNK